MDQSERGAELKASWLDLVANPVRLEILRVLSMSGDATMAELAMYGTTSEPTLRRHLDALVSVGLVDRRCVESDGQTPGRPASRFSLPSQVRDSVRAVFMASRL